IYLMKYSQDYSKISSIFYWVKKGVKSFHEDLQNLPADKYPWFLKYMEDNEHIQFKDLDEIPEEGVAIKNAFFKEGIISYLGAKISYNNKLYGYLELNSVENVRTWNAIDVYLTKLTGELIINAFERTRLFNDLEVSEKFHRNLIELSPSAIFIHAQGKILFSNQQGIELVGAKDFTELTSRNVLEYVHPDYREGVINRIKQSSEPDYVLPSTQEKFVKLNGEIIDVQVTGTQITFENQQANLVIVTDLTDVIASESLIMENERKYRNLFEQSNDAIYILDEAGKFVEVNQSLMDIFEITQADVDVGLKARDFYRHAEDLRTFMEIISKKDRVKNFETQFITKSGKILDGLLSATVRRDKNAKILGYQGIIRDITSENETKENLIQAQKLESLGLLAGGIAHDFNNILMGILGFANLAGLEIQDNQVLKQMIDHIVDSTKRAAGLTGQLLSYSGKGTFKKYKVDLNKLIYENKALMSVSVQKTVDLKYQLGSPAPIEADPTQIIQIFLNLIINASESIKNNSGKITVETGVVQLSEKDKPDLYRKEEFTPGKYSFIKVSDNGSGMTADVKDKVFDPFFSTKFTGRGLGLASVYGIIKSHNGNLQVISQENGGSQFITYFHALEAKALDEKKSMVRYTKQALTEKTEQTVLLVDDDPMILNVSKLMLERLGYLVTTASNGKEALEKVQKEYVDFIVLDQVMPVMDGRTTLQKLKELGVKSRVIISSGYNEVDMSEIFKGVKIHGFLQKPYTMDALKEILAD
ncbi:MAG: PAS domain S-box protein, partial [Candidatus Heimdallarchaeota archaeon]|nr:PAS domain S-box protein [Candidatus Heimdallarchaeota archaeon]